jgi:hypothetical protein
LAGTWVRWSEFGGKSAVPDTSGKFASSIETAGEPGLLDHCQRATLHCRWLRTPDHFPQGCAVARVDCAARAGDRRGGGGNTIVSPPRPSRVHARLVRDLPGHPSHERHRSQDGPYEFHRLSPGDDDAPTGMTGSGWVEGLMMTRDVSVAKSVGRGPDSFQRLVGPRRRPVRVVRPAEPRTRARARRGRPAGPGC